MWIWVKLQIVYRRRINFLIFENRNIGQLKNAKIGEWNDFYFNQIISIYKISQKIIFVEFYNFILIAIHLEIKNFWVWVGLVYINLYFGSIFWKDLSIICNSWKMCRTNSMWLGLKLKFVQIYNFLIIGNQSPWNFKNSIVRDFSNFYFF